MGYVKIGDEVLDVEVQTGGYTMVSTGNHDWYVFQDEEHAGEEARSYWEYMANNDKDEFACMVGSETLIDWALGNYAGPGYTKVKSLSEWLDLWLDTPEEQWGTYDGCAEYGTVSKEVMEELGFDDKNVVFYRHN